MSKLKCQRYKLRGQSLVEVIIAVAIFVIIAGSSVVTILGSFLTSRLGEEETQATLLVIEGLEAAQSIRNQDWNDLTDGDHGLLSSGSWSFSGTSDTDGKFSRVVNVSSVERDLNGDIVESGGTVDEDTKKVVSSVTWNFTTTRTIS